MEPDANKSNSFLSISEYWSLLKDLNCGIKLDLASMLIESVKSSVSLKQAKNKKADIDDFYGAWSDDKYMDANQMVAIIKQSRNFNC